MSIISKLFKKQIQNEVNKNLNLIATKATKAYINRWNSSSNILTSGGGGEKNRRALANSGGLIYLNHSVVRKNARRIFHESSQARAIVERFSNTVADVGLVLEPAPKTELLGITQEKGEKWSKNVGLRFDAWARNQLQNRSGRMNFYQSMRLYQIGQHRDNDIFIRLYYSSDKKLLNPLQFEMIDPDQLRMDSLTYSSGYNTKSDGIERNEKGEEIAYNIQVEDASKPGRIYSIKIPVMSKDGKRRYMLHGFTPEYAGQGRGYSRLAHLIQPCEQLTDLSISHIQKAIAQSIMAFTIESDDERAPQEINIGAVGIDDPVDSVQTTNPVTGESIQYNQITEATFKEAGAAIVIQPQGNQKLTPVPNTAPSESYQSFTDAEFTYMTASSSMPIEVALMKFGTNYSASRASLLMFWEEVVRWREEMATDYLNYVYEMWLSEEIAAGRITAPGWSDPILKAAWLHCRWIGSSVPNIDPGKKAKADQENLKMGATTLKRVARDLNGSSYENNVANLAREIEKLPKMPWENKKEEPARKDLINREESDDE